MPSFTFGAFAGMNGVVNDSIGDVVSDPRAILGGVTNVDDIANMEVAERGGMVAADGNGGVLRDGESLGLGGVLPRDMDAPSFGLGARGESDGEGDDGQNGGAGGKSSFHKTNCIRQSTGRSRRSLGYDKPDFGEVKRVGKAF